MISKKAKQRQHTIKRAEERYNLKLTRKDIQNIVNKIKSAHSDVKFVKKQSNRVTLWDVLYNNNKMRVVYDKIRNNIITILPIKPIEIEEVDMTPKIAKRINELTQAYIDKHITKKEMISNINLWLHLNTISFNK